MARVSIAVVAVVVSLQYMTTQSAKITPVSIKSSLIKNKFILLFPFCSRFYASSAAGCYALPAWLSGVG